MRTIHMSEDQHKRCLALVRCQRLIEDIGGFNPWDELLDALELDKPPSGDVVPLASRRAPREDLWAKHRRVTDLERAGLDETMRRVGGERG